MTAVAAPLGLLPVYHPSGLERPMQYQIASGYATSIFKGDPVLLATATGTITVGTAAVPLLGVFIGVEYIDVTGKPTFANFYPASQLIQSGTLINAYVLTDLETVYEIQAIGSMTQVAIGKEFDVVIGTGNVNTGLSSTALNTVAATTGAQKQFRVVDFGRGPDNAVGDAFTVVRVTLANSQMRAPTTSI